MANPAAPVKTGTIPFTRDGETYQTFYKLFGSLENSKRRPLVMMHGGPGLVHDYLLPFSDLAVMADTPVVLYDQIGNGLSTHLRDKPADFWSIELFIDELENVLAHLGIDGDFDLGGHSWGGIVGTEFAVQRRPRGLRHLVLTDALAAPLMAGMADPKAYHAALLVFHRTYGCTVVPPPKEYLYMLEMVFGEKGDPTVTSVMFPKIINWSIIDRLHNIEVPTLVMNGAKDIAQDFVIAPFFQKIPKAKWITFAKSSHTPFWEERELYMKQVANFLEL
ncbi:uncharacterized protein PHACADRAFT_171311 [Phanerochaete carnosa HHB-10118-sp]|uniref:AB hydrolase-1 domain-containing protein n=1 Tax=Phanerochaete carnosa (strain HHB-10118-sp) TaxID=650164 RepID=K5W2I1_PHACS|nr:uncharacterized protein PHACADRAFT_171311 [Phanerochaete carnosa HHB-10118-sp]EKM58078.1 hypothetical protein PHACADRAFT_171311 [Phanerochaete carnosa HHB-10118-sp]